MDSTIRNFVEFSVKAPGMLVLFLAALGVGDRFQPLDGSAIRTVSCRHIAMLQTPHLDKWHNTALRTNPA